MGESQRFILRRRFTLFKRRYQLHSVGPGGGDGAVIAWARESLALSSEQVTFYGDKARTRPIFGFLGKTGEDGYQVTDAEGQLIGRFRRDVQWSSGRSKWELSTPGGLIAVGRERSAAATIVRHVLELFGKSPVGYHVDFTTAGGDVVLTSERTFSILGRYQFTIPALPGGTQLDWRLGAAVTAALDTLQGR